MADHEPLKLYEVDVFPAVSATADELQRFKVCARSATEAHFGALDAICLGIPTSEPADWLVKKIEVVKTYKI